MAFRPVFLPSFDGKSLVKEVNIEFTWYPGFSLKQKQLSISSLHKEIKKKLNIEFVLEASTKSPCELGISLSAFNLMINDKKPGNHYSVESAFQSAKIFDNGGPYVDLRNKPSVEAKKDIRLKNSGKLIKFKFFNKEWLLTPKTAFYDWLYINALYLNKNLYENVLRYEAFTDIEFNPAKSLNCQARSLALFVAIFKTNQIDNALSSKEKFIDLYKKIFYTISTPYLLLR